MPIIVAPKQIVLCSERFVVKAKRGDRMTEKEFLRIVGRNIAYYRKLAGYSQKEFAKRSGLKLVTIATLECGLSGTTVKTLKKIADALDILPEFLLKIPEGRRQSS